MNAPAKPSFIRRLRSVSGLGLRLALGIALGIFLHYLLYRLSLPLQPFIYVAF